MSEDNISPVDAAEMRRLRWQCRRGMRELDVVLARYLEVQYEKDDVPTRRVFDALLRRQDPQIADWILGREQATDPATAALIARLQTIYDAKSQ